MPEPRTAKQIAEHIIRDAVTDIEWGDIGEMTEAEAEAEVLDEEAYDALRREVDDLISTATVTITFPQADGEAAPEVPESIRAIGRRAFAGRPPDADGVFSLLSDRNPWRALDAALAAVLPAVVPPGHVVVARADLEAYLNRGTTGDVLREVHALRRLLAAVGDQP